MAVAQHAEPDLMPHDDDAAEQAHDDVQAGDDEAPLEPAIYTMGCGDLLREHLLRRLQHRRITHVVDLRSAPFEFSRRDLMPPALHSFLAEHDIKYLYLGDSLGDRPEDVSVYLQGGAQIDYLRCRERAWAQAALDRLMRAHDLGFRLMLLGREADPCRCMRARLVGRMLLERGVSPRHITAFDSLMTQAQVLRVITRIWREDPTLSWIPRATRTRSR